MFPPKVRGKSPSQRGVKAGLGEREIRKEEWSTIFSEKERFHHKRKKRWAVFTGERNESGVRLLGGKKGKCPKESCLCRFGEESIQHPVEMMKKKNAQARERAGLCGKKREKKKSVWKRQVLPVKIGGRFFTQKKKGECLQQEKWGKGKSPKTGQKYQSVKEKALLGLQWGEGSSPQASGHHR